MHGCKFMNQPEIHIHYHNSNDCVKINELLTKIGKIEMTLDEIKTQLVAAVTLLNSNATTIQNVQAEVVGELQNIAAATATIKAQSDQLAAATGAAIPDDVAAASATLDTALGNLNTQIQNLDLAATPVAEVATPEPAQPSTPPTPVA